MDRHDLGDGREARLSGRGTRHDARYGPRVPAVRVVNDVVRFCLELASLAGLAVWGWRTGPTGVNVVLAIAAPLAAAALWGAFVAPKAPGIQEIRGAPARGDGLRRGDARVRGAGLGTAAVVLGVASALHLGATFPLHQRGPAAG